MLNQVRVAGAVLGVFAGLAVRVDWASRCARASLSVVVTLVVLRLCGRLESASPADVLLTAVLTLMCTSKVLSPQYNLWIVGLMAACAIQPHPTFPTVVRLLAISTVCGHLLYPWLYIPFQQGAALAVMVHTVRIVTLVAATILMWRSVLSARPTHRASPAL